MKIKYIEGYAVILQDYDKLEFKVGDIVKGWLAIAPHGRVFNFWVMPSVLCLGARSVELGVERWRPASPLEALAMTADE